MPHHLSFFQKYFYALLMCSFLKVESILRLNHTSRESMKYYWQVNDNTEIWSICLDKTWFFTSCNYVHTTIWMHHMNTNKTQREKSWCELQKNFECCLEQILKATLNKSTAVQPLTPSPLASHSNKMSNTYGVQLEKQELTHRPCSLLDFCT